MFGKYHGYDSAVLGYVSMSEEINVNFVERVAQQTILYDLQDPGCTTKDKN